MFVVVGFLELHMSTRRSALRGCVRRSKATCRILALRVEHSADGRDTIHTPNYLLERMYECLVCTHPAPLPTVVCNPSRLCGREMLQIEAHRMSRDSRVGPGTMHSRQARVAVDLSDALA
jgi:hypothetical protein